jgi:NADH-quinone oxidoreductase subunit E
MHDQKDNHANNEALEPINAAAPQSGVDAFELSAEERDAIEHEKHHYEIHAPPQSKH